MATGRITRFAVDWAGKGYLYPTIEPHSLPELADFFMWNALSPCQIKAQWSTDVTRAQSGAEERRGLVDRPYRTIATRFTGIDRDLAARLWALVMRAHHQRLVCPLFPDQVRLSATAAATATTILAPVLFRRFYAGGRAVVVTLDRSMTVTQAEIVRIASVTPTQLNLSGPLAMTHQAGVARVVPLLEVDVSLENSHRLPAGNSEDIAIELSEVVGASAIPPWIPLGNDPAAETYRQIPIFPFTPNWASPPVLNVDSGQDRHQQGRASVTARVGERPTVGFEFELTALDRATAFSMLEWIDSRRGRVAPFWFLDPRDLIAPVAWAGTSIDVTRRTFLTDAERFLKYVAVQTNGGARHVREVVDVSDVGGNLRLRFAEPVPGLTLGDLRRVRQAYLSRFDSDEYVEDWPVTEKMRVSLKTRELLEERAVPIVTRDAAIVSATPSFISDLHMGCIAPINTLKPTGLPTAIDGDQVGTWQDVLGGSTNRLITQVPSPEQAYHTRQLMGSRTNIRCANLGAGGEKGHFRAGQPVPWYSNAKGMTLFVVGQRHTSNSVSQVDDFLAGYTNAAGSAADILFWQSTALTLWEDSGVLDTRFQVLTEDLFAPYGVFHVMALTWKPGEYVRIYRDGELKGESLVTPVDLPIGTTDTALRGRALRWANELGATPGAFDSAAHGFVVFRRALHLDEMDIVGAYLAGLVNTTWQRLVT